jgi:lipoprotein NlpD
MKFFKFKNLRNASVYITPNFPHAETKRYKFKIISIVSFFLAYSLILAILVIVLLALSPAKDFIYIFENKNLELQSERIKQLDSQVIFLTKELEKMSSTNQRLKYALILAGTDSLDSTAAIYDSLRKTDERNSLPPGGGNIFYVFKDFLNLFLTGEDTTDNSYILKPTYGKIINQFNPVEGHLGIDFGAKVGSPVYAALGGLVIFADYTVDDGNMMIIESENDIITIYKHCSELLKTARENVVQGELIALSGNSGYRTTGPHLHFELWDGGKAIDPNKFIIN